MWGETNAKTPGNFSTGVGGWQSEGGYEFPRTSLRSLTALASR